MLQIYFQNIAFKESNNKKNNLWFRGCFYLRDIFSNIITTNNKNSITKIGKRKKGIYDKTGKRKK